MTFVTAGALVFSLVGLVSTHMIPYVNRAAGLTVQDAIVSTLPLNLMSIMASVLISIVLGYFVVRYSAFSGPMETGETY